MHAPPTPRRESARIAFLRSLRVLDTDRDAMADAIAAAAARIANTPISAISLVDVDRQWFMASCGLSVRETGRDISFCGHAMVESGPLIIPDAREDARFADNPMVTGPPHIRFYGGFPLLVDGTPLGALCLIDDVPRTVTPSQIARLADLAALASDWIARAGRRTVG